jgi:hypothetical protein
MLEGKHRLLESKSNKAPGKESDFKLAALCRRDRLPKYFCNNIGPSRSNDGQRGVASRQNVEPRII